MTNWNKEKDFVLFNLFEKSVSDGGVSPNHLDKDTIKEVIRNHFPDRKYSSFAPLIRRKAREYKLGQSLDGARKQEKNSNPGKQLFHLLYLF